MRISGFASGMDIDSMVKSLMKSHQAPVTKLQKQALLIEQQQEAYRTVNSAIVDFRNNKLASFNLTSAINAKKAEVSGNTSAISATATGASAGTYNVKVERLASATSLTVDTTVTGLTDGKFTGDGAVEINGSTISFKEGDTLDNLISKINNDKKANVTLIYSSSSNKLSITSKTTGAIEFELDQNFHNVFGTSEADLENQIVGKTAKVTINGVDMESDKNQLAVNGVTIHLKSKHEEGESSTINITTDTDKVFNTIKGFIDSYNSVIELINGKLSEDKYRNFTPLTNEEKEGMTDKQIELWESKSKSGMLKNDSILTNLVSNMRTAVMSEVGQGENELSLLNLGITTGQWFEGGKLIIKDEAKLKDAIENNLQDVVDLFSLPGNSQTTNKATDPNTGVFNRLTSITMDSLVALSERAGTSRTSGATTGSFLESSLLSMQKKSINDKISNLNARLLKLESQYYKQFTAMETAINKYNSQAGSIASYSVF